MVRLWSGMTELTFNMSPQAAEAGRPEFKANLIDFANWDPVSKEREKKRRKEQKRKGRKERK